MAFPSAGTASKTAFAFSVTSMAVNLPASIASGDRLIAVVQVRNSGTWTKPTGWTQVFSPTAAGGVGDFTVFEKIADGTEGSTATWVASVATTASWQVIKITGAHASTASEATTVNSGGSPSTNNPPSLTPSWGADDTLWLAVMGTTANGTTITAAPTNYSGFSSNVASSGGSQCNTGIASRQLNASSEDPGSFTTSSDRWWVAATIAIRPAAATGTSTSDERGVWITGEDTANDTRDIRVTGQSSSNDSRDVRITGGSASTTDIAFDADSQSVNTGFSSGPVTKTWSHTVTGSDPILVVVADIWQDVAGTGTVTSATYNGTSLTNLVSFTGSGTTMHTEIWYLLNPSTGANNVSVTVTGATDAIKLSAISFTGVSDVGATNTASGFSATGSVSLTTTVDKAWVVAGMMKFGTAAVTVGNSFSSAMNDTTSSTVGTSTYYGPVSPTGSVTAQNTWSGSSDWAIAIAELKPATGSSTATNDSRDVRITGASTSSDNRNLRLSGEEVASDTRNLRVTGTATASNTRDVRLTGEELASDNRDIRLVGQVATSDTRNLRLTGSNTGSDSYQIRITGEVTSSDSRGVYISGTERTSDARDIRIVGQLSTSDTRNLRITGEIHDNRDIRITGQASIYDSRDVRVTGTSADSDDRELRIIGLSTLFTHQDIRIKGESSASDSRNLRITGTSTGADSRGVRVTGEEQSSDTRGVRLTGTAITNDTRDIRITGLGTATSDTHNLRITGELHITWDPSIIFVDGDPCLQLFENFYIRL